MMIDRQKKNKYFRSLLSLMALHGPAKVEKLIVEESSRTGTVKLEAIPTMFKIANNSDTGYEAMVDVLASAKGNEQQVTLDVGPGDEIDRIALNTF